MVNPIQSESPTVQAEAEAILIGAVTTDERLIQADPIGMPAITHEQKRLLAYQLWEANGGVVWSPLTLNFWLEAEVMLESESE